MGWTTKCPGGTSVMWSWNKASCESSRQKLAEDQHLDVEKHGEKQHEHEIQQANTEAPEQKYQAEECKPGSGKKSKSKDERKMQEDILKIVEELGEEANQRRMSSERSLSTKRPRESGLIDPNDAPKKKRKKKAKSESDEDSPKKKSRKKKKSKDKTKDKEGEDHAV